jgi:hypothetical protein
MGALWRNACIPAVDLRATAHSIARFYAVPPTKQLAIAHFIGEDVAWGLGLQIEPDDPWGMDGLAGTVVGPIPQRVSPSVRSPAGWAISPRRTGSTPP